MGDKSKMIARVLIVILCLLAPPAFSQNADADKNFDFELWELTATRSEGVIKDAEALSPALETLRATLAEFRSRALVVQDADLARIDTLASQLDALGPAPADGEAEAEEVASRRRELNTQLAEARAPVLAAQEAYNRADGMIGEIDKIIRERQADQLLTIGISPFNPVHWPGAYTALSDFVGDIRDEVNEGLNSEAQMVVTRRNLPGSLIFMVLGVALLTRARHWLLAAMGQVPMAVRRSDNEARALIVSTTQVLVPMLGVWSIIRAIELTQLVGLRGEIVLSAAPWMGLCFFGALWMARVIFAQTDAAPGFFDLSADTHRTARRISINMGFVLALDLLLVRIAAPTDFPESAHIILSFPIVVAAGFLLIRMGPVLDPGRDLNDGHQAENPLQQRLYRLITRALIGIGVAGPVLAAVGYFAASTSFVFPAIQTLALLGLALILYRFLGDLADHLVSSGQEDGLRAEHEKSPTLVPVALGFSLICFSIPVLALIWGARVSDLSEAWTLVSEGFNIGERRISVTDFLTFAIIFAIGYTVTRLLQSTLRTSVLPRLKLDAGGRNAILTGTGYVGIFLAALAAITAAGLDLSSLAIVAGALSVGIGFGLQAIVSNFVSGIILLVERPIKEGDWVEVGAHSGYVRKISVRSTEIETFDRATVVVPNADFISGTVTNWTHSNMNGRVKVPIGVAYDSDPEQVRQILTEIAEAHEMVDHRFNVSVVFMGFGADSMDFEIRAILKDVNWVLSAKSDMNFEIVRRFREEGIEIPFAQRDINLRNLGDLGQTIGNAMKGKS